MADRRIDESEENEPWIPPDNRLFDRFSIIVILTGALLFSVGLAIDLAIPKYTEIGDALRECGVTATEACRAALLEFGEASHAISRFSWLSFFAASLQAFGLTVIAAVFISSTVDYRTRKYFFQELARKTEILGVNILMGMFEARHNPRLFNLVKDKIFEKKIMRRNIDINYTICDLDADFTGTRLEGEQFVRVDVILSTVSENINLARTSSNGRVKLPVNLGLPNPMLDELKPYVRINSFRIGDDVLDQARIDDINAELQEKLKDDASVDAFIKVDECWLDPGEQVTVSGSYTMVKELQDTEVFRSIEIAENIHLTVVNRSSANLVIRARSLSHGTLHGQKSPSAQQWKLDDLSLPLQGIMVWWKKAAGSLGPLNVDNS